MARLFTFSRNAFKIPLPYAIPIFTFLLVMAVFPQIDLIVSGWFYDPAKGGFWLGHHRWIDALGEFTSMASAIFVVVCFVLYGYGIRKKRIYWGLDRRLVIYLGLVMIIGPLLVVTVGFKEFWGRARPLQVTEFGGDKTFTPYYEPTNACATDCSFPSGHSSRGFYFLALAFAGYKLNRRRSVGHMLLGGAMVFGVITAGLRVIEGKHFLSDVTVAGFILAYVCWVLYGIMWPKGPPLLPEPELKVA